MDRVFAGLAGSAFRRRFRLGPRERAYLDEKGLAAVLEHARDFVDKRLAPDAPPNRLPSWLRPPGLSRRPEAPEPELATAEA